MAIHRVEWQAEFPAQCQRGAIAIGNFDGAHRGHAVLLSALARRARQMAGPAIAITFDPHPLTILRPEVEIEHLTTPEQRAGQLLRLGADEVLILHVNADLLNLHAEEFFARVIRDRLDAHALVEGPTFAFGKRREGDLELLARLCKTTGLTLDIIEPVALDGVEVSSSRIRAQLHRGDVESARQFLGRDYSLRGHVGAGARRGRTIGFPTANLDLVETIIPGDGVYAVRATLLDGTVRLGAANIGPNPTFAEQVRKLEIHLLDYSGDLYGQWLNIEFAQRLRDTRAFDNINDLVAQLTRDVAQVRSLLTSIPGERP